MSILECFIAVVRLALPSILGMAITVSVLLINMHFLGKYDMHVLAGAGVGNILINLNAFQVVYGLNGTLESKVGEAYAKQDYRQCGILLNRAKLIVIVFLIPISLLFLFVADILEAIGID